MNTTEGLVVLTAFALFEGYREQLMIRSGARWWERRLADGVTVRRKEILGLLTVAYHIPMGCFWLGLCYVVGLWQFFPAFCVIQDWAYFRFHPYDTADENDWLHNWLGGVYLKGENGSRNPVFVAFAYVAGIVLSVIFFILTEV